MVCSYLVHHGYVGAAEAFAKSTGQEIEEDWTNIKNRQAIQKLVLDGKMGEATKLTDKLYPGFLQLHPALHFMLKVRQFIEMVSGNDDDALDNHDQDMTNSNNDSDVVMNGKETNGNSTNVQADQAIEEIIETPSTTEEADEDSNEEEFAEAEQHMEVDPPSVTANPDKFQKLIIFGQKVKAMLAELEQVRGIKNEANSKMLEDAFALLAYPNPWDSPVGWQLATSEREFISSALNSALLEAGGYPARPPLEVGLTHAKQLVKLMANPNYQLGASAYANLEDVIKI